METNLDKNEQEQNDKKEWVSPEMQELDLESGIIGTTSDASLYGSS
jgi:hypothetical protein